VTYNIVTVIVGLMGHLSPLLAAILMPLSSLATLSLVALVFRRGGSAGVRKYVEPEVGAGEACVTAC
jgi:hypothetical protein